MCTIITSKAEINIYFFWKFFITNTPWVRRRRSVKKTPPVVFSRWGNKLVRLPQIALFLQILAQHCTVVDLILLLHHIIGRFYRCSDLHRLVELILLSYTRQPVDFIMHHFDVLQMADQFREFRRTPPLIEHIGAKSTIDVESVITMSSTNTYWHLLVYRMSTSIS